MSPSATVDLGILSAGVYIFTVQGAKDERRATSSCEITVLRNDPPSCEISAISGRSDKVNPSAKLYLSASMSDIRGSGNITARWLSILGGFSQGISLTDAAFTPISSVFILSSQAAKIPFGLGLNAGSLLSRASYTFRLITTNPAGSSTADISLTTNGAPTSGTVAISPLTGQPLTTFFTIKADTWCDDADDYPLLYTYQYILGVDSATAVEKPLLVKSLFSTYDKVLFPMVSALLECLSTVPAMLMVIHQMIFGVCWEQGPQPSYNLTAVVYVADQYGAASRAVTGFNVLPMTASIATLSRNISSTLTAAISSYNVESVYQVVALSSPGLSSAACTDPTACSSIRGDLLKFVSKAVNLQDTDSVVVTQQAQAVATLTAEGGSLSPDSQTVAVSLIRSIAASGATTGVSKEGFSAMGKSMDSILRTDTVNNPGHATAISDSVSDVVKASWVDLYPNDGGMSITTSAVNMSCGVAYALSLTNKTFAAPGTNNSVKLAPTGVDSFFSVQISDPVATAIVSMKNVRPSKKHTNTTSPLLRFSLTKKDSSSGNRRMLLLSDQYQAITTVLNYDRPIFIGVSIIIASFHVYLDEKD